MPKLPEPPGAEELKKVEPDVVVLPVGALLFRIYVVGGTHPSSWDGFHRFGPVGTARFDHPDPPRPHQNFGLLYLAAEIKACVAGVFQEKRAVDLRSGEPWLVALRLAREGRLLSLQGTGQPAPVVP